jgi:hypothetical protein
VTRVVVAALLALAGCRVPIAELAVIQVATTTGPPVHLGSVTGRSCRWWALGVPLGLPRIEEAVHDALDEHGGTMLRDVVLRSDHPVYGPVGRHCYTVLGTAWGSGGRHGQEVPDAMRPRSLEK